MADSDTNCPDPGCSAVVYEGDRTCRRCGRDLATPVKSKPAK